MTKVVLDKQTQVRFRNMKEPLQLVDESGQLLGLFTPTVDPSLLAPQIRDDEIQKRLAKGGGRPLADILHDLEQRAEMDHRVSARRRAGTR